jgi:PAS domain S-box-containing protein
MRLRHILLVLSLLTFLSVSAGGALYYSALRQGAFQEAERQAVASVELIHRGLNTLLSEHRKAVVTLAGMSSLRQALRTGTDNALYKANMVLDHFDKSLGADVCYLMTRAGTTIASSNRNDIDSFVGQNFAFRPYFQQALRGKLGSYMALGATSRRRGVYHAYPVYDDPKEGPLGVAVIKSSIERIEKELGLPADDMILITDPRGVIFITNRDEWLYHFAWPPTDYDLARVAQERQFGGGPWHWVGLTRGDDRHAQDQSGRHYLIHEVELERFPGWKIVQLRDTQHIARAIAGPLLHIAGPVAVLLSTFIGISVLLLYHRASREIQGRRSAEEALRESEQRYRSLYHNTPAMLHSVDTEGRLLSVSDFWVETLGYRREEVIGRHITDFLSAESRRYALETVIPRFFNNGSCKDVPYRFVKKSGEPMDVLLSAVADRDSEGRIQRSLTVSIDMTERNRAEANLRQAKEELSRYSKELEKQVRQRTGEIISILRYTPAVVYMKDRQNRYLLVNSRFEQLFGVDGTQARGRSDEELLPAQVAGQFNTHDRQVLAQGSSLHVEEQIPQADSLHTYLSVKFPIYDEAGQIYGMCGIASDITPLKKAQEQLRRLSASIMTNQEKERAAIARELHDELGQLLTALRMDAAWLQEHFKHRDARAAEHAGAMCTLIDTTIEEVRGISIRLRPGVLDDLGLVDALEWFTTEFERRAQIACVFTHGAIPAVENTIATAAYRIAQEAMTNVARHARASRAEVCLHMQDGALMLEVSDDGRGFDPAAVSETGELGLAGMRERAVLVGGRLQVVSRPGQGTSVQLRVPLHGEAGSRA